ncbi:hypothetical protein GCM10010329_71210 [Streptomyces spiroverticillatus]|uniref:Uncharacterized protein n=1 Tax=Streptomyces finlayi TaxID=67296 RepID=A0A918X0G8_9ACTN|nr:hypothetical protein GCM10010329_71210 [Streptomyces spiroverticillatus]GHD00356.1 hypothetical protein GCM10010334_44640 [Streptomyces finlayi]
MLESILDLGPLPASRGGLFERGCALFRGKGRKSHAYVTSDVELSDTDRRRASNPARGDQTHGGAVRLLSSETSGVGRSRQ